jgi:putative FmdB family regulatory protein
MPIYEYSCKKCGEFEVMQRITEKPLSRCPTCNGKVNKLISQTSFQLKGSGWYITDYGRSGSKGGKKKDSATESKDTTAESKSSPTASKTADSSASTKKDTKAAA